MSSIVTPRRALLAAFPAILIARPKEEEVEVGPTEDLMQEHGLLKRILLIYREAIRRIDQKQDLPPATLATSARMIRTFVEDYHEKNEENHIFPRFRKAGKLTDLVSTLLDQHQKGRILTDRIIRLSTASALKDPAQARQLRGDLELFIRMYEPHEAREDTVLFPAFRKIVSKHEYDALGEQFEDNEHKLFGEDGFEKEVDRVAGLEKTLGIYDLAQFTPKV